MSRILGVMGSPRKNGNTHVLVSAILDGAAEAGATTDLVLLNELDIRECDGCHLCWSGKPCGKKDDMNDLYPRIDQSDVIVFGTPVYWYGPTAILKAFIDRFVYYNCPENRPQIAGKRAALAIPYEDTDAETVAPLLTFFEKSLAYLEMHLCGQVIVPGVTRRGEVRDRVDCMNAARALGRELAGGAA